MIKVRLDLTGKNPPIILEAYDSPNDKSLCDIAHIIARVVDLSEFSNQSTDESEVHPNDQF